MESLNPSRVKAVEEWAVTRREIAALEEKLAKKRKRVKELEKDNLFLGNIKGMCSKGTKKKASRSPTRRKEPQPGEPGTSGTAKKRKLDSSSKPKSSSSGGPKIPVSPAPKISKGTSSASLDEENFARTLAARAGDPRFREDLERLLSLEDTTRRGRLDSESSESTFSAPGKS
ncbi:HDAg-like protein [Chusan Island toad virus 1]|uniref:HDAg-like protein n=1 Tax=Chusan Island toad virus 1 TaxID=2849699 RepID=A0A5B8ZSI9_9VIRU|nr:HDAg-like protein [Chusan Island toad virus 1]QED55974.1 HDAg-like protein [Chusan Island toad virus 1]